MKNILFVTFICLFVNCEKIYSDNKLSLIKTEYNGNELKIDGYYYTIYQSNKESDYVFFNNGVLLNAGDGYDLTIPNSIEEAISSNDSINKLKQNILGIV